MKRLIAVILASALVLSGCSQQTIAKPDSNTPSTIENTDKEHTNETSESKTSEHNSTAIPTIAESTATVATANIPEFNDLSDPKLLQYVQDSVYAGLVDQFSGEDYKIENVSAIYYSKEYLDELDYNSKANIFFGYTLQELDEQFKGTRYVFTLNDEGKTTIQPFEDYDDTYDQFIKYVAIGAGVILVLVTISCSSMNAAELVSVILVASVNALAADDKSSSVLSGVAVVGNNGILANDYEQVVKEVAYNGIEIFMEMLINSLLSNGQ